MLPPNRDYWTAFRKPSEFNATGLYLLQPYQPGKIPLVLIHGVASDAITWEEMIEAMSSDPGIMSRYQIWVYQYPTGLPYLKSAADLRRELVKTRALLDPTQTDAAIDQTVLVGHSMGGLIAKLQVSHSDDQIWQAISDIPLETALGSGRVSEEALSELMFEPVPFVRRVVYMATPHLGSNWTQHPLGKLGRWLIDIPQQVQSEYIGLTRGQPGLFHPRPPEPPTSLDHLVPGNSIIKATNSLRRSDAVDAHSIIGTGYLSPDGYVGDGVVAVISARQPNVRTEYFVQATHSGILRHRGAKAELMCILSRL
jgi:pimeloyl-ACP methyl ester carboxylesterase